VNYVSSNGAMNSAVAILTSAAAAVGFLSAEAALSRPIDQLVVLGEDGRIGIYNTEQRKARIELFHSKRAARIWRKRIKYDCRKKLADSRPRIKGRFVKRSDMNLPPEEIQRIYGGQLPEGARLSLGIGIEEPELEIEVKITTPKRKLTKKVSERSERALTKRRILGFESTPAKWLQT